MIEYESSAWVQTMNLSCNRRGSVDKPSALKLLRRYAIVTIKLEEVNGQYELGLTGIHTEYECQMQRQLLICYPL